MGKKGKKTRWRELPITLDKPYAAHDQHQQQQQQQQQQSNRQPADAKPVNFAAAAGRRSHHAQHHQQQPQHQQQQQLHSPPPPPQHQPNLNHSASTGQQHHRVESSTVTFNEDEYTKITTPRQDVLFKKGYLGRRKHTSVPVITEVINENEDGVSVDNIINPLDEMCPPGEYVDPSAMYILNGGGYEVYDPYTGNVTMLMGPPPGHYPPVGGHPMLAAMPYQPVPMQALDWYNPANTLAGDHWMSPPVYQSNRHHHKKSTSDTLQNCGAQNSDATSNGAQESSADDQHSLYQTPQPYGLYPGYIFPAPLYNYNGMSIHVPQPQSPPSPSISCEYTNGKRRKKKKRRKRGGVTDECSDSSSEEQKSQSGASSDLVPDSEKTSDSGVQTNNSGGSTPVNVIPVQLSHSAPPFHMECPQPFEIVHGTPILVHHHHPHPDQMTAYYHPIPQYAQHVQTSVGYQAIPEEELQTAVVASDDMQPDVGEPAAGYSAENSDSGISSPNSEVMVKGMAEKKHEKPQPSNGTDNGTGGVQTAPKKSRNKKSNKQRDKIAATADPSAVGCKTKSRETQKSHHHEGGGKKSSKIAKEPAIIKKLNAKKMAKVSKPETEKLETAATAAKSFKGDRDDEDDDEREVSDEHEPMDERVSDGMAQLSISPPDADDEPFCSLECTPRSTADNNAVQFQFSKSQSMDSCESVEEETFATAVNGTGNSDTENETSRLLQDEAVATTVETVTTAEKIVDSDASSAAATPAASTPEKTPLPAPSPLAGPITEAVTKWLNDQGGLMLAAPCLDDDYDCLSTDVDDDGDSEYDDFEDHPTNAPTTTVSQNSPKNVRGNPYPALSRSYGSRVAGAPSSPPPSPSPTPALPLSNDQRKTGLISSGICCLTQ